MPKKKNKISVNTLEKYCDHLNLTPQEIQMPYGEGETLSFTVKPLLSMDESIRFIEDVVRECIMADDMLIIPLARDFIVKRNLMTYYANFTMPESQSKTYDFVMAATGIIAVILDNIDLEQFNMIRQSIDERIAFEERKMIAEQQSNVRQITENVSEFVSKMSGLFDGIDAEQMGDFVTSMGKMAQNTEISAQSLAGAFLESRNTKE